MIYDYHLYTEFSDDSNTSTSLQIEEATELDMKEIYTTDYHGYDSGFCGRDFTLNIPAYPTALRIFRVDYRGHIRINIKIELGLQKHLRQYSEHFVERYEDSFDFVTGSSHLVKSMNPYDPEYWNNQGEMIGFKDFFEASLARARGLCRTSDSPGHLGYAVRYVPHQNDFYDYRHLSQWVDPLSKILIENGKSLECDTDGSKYDLGQSNPCRKILMHYWELDGETITIGSDAYTPEYVGYTLDIYHKLLLDCGHKYLTVYYGRKPKFTPL